MMKMIFLLQQVYKVQLGYRYEIYTYGPYSAEVASDVNFAEQLKIISISEEKYTSGNVGYHLNPANGTSNAIKEAQSFLEESQGAIDSVIHMFGDKTAKELELSSTIVYLYVAYNENGYSTSREDISSEVHKIKPHFSQEIIQKEYDTLANSNILSKAV
jgi:uncharacterized protein YwgA